VFWPFYLIDLFIGRGLREWSRRISTHFGKIFQYMLDSSASSKFKS
jgi:hypothetical protein